MYIKIISGIYGHNKNGCIIPTNSQSEPFEVDDTEAARLISLGVAKEYKVKSPNLTTTNECDKNENPKYSTETDIQELRNIAKGYGISFSPNIGKEKLLERLDEFLEEHNDGPKLSVSDPVI